jgi:hypothetical protein
MKNVSEIINRDLKNLGYPKLFGSREMSTREVMNGFNPAMQIGAQIYATTDWDFSQQYSELLHNYLIAAGFKAYSKEELGAYADDLTVGVYIKEYHPPYSWKTLDIYSSDEVVIVNVVLHTDETQFRRVWDNITPEFYYKHLWKRSPRYEHLNAGEAKDHIREIMNQLYRIANVPTR